MSLHIIGTYSYSSAALAFFILAILLLTVWRGKLFSWALSIPVVVSALWAGLAAYQASQQLPGSLPLAVLELLRDWTWLFFLIHMLRSADSKAVFFLNRLKQLTRLAYALPVLLLLLLVVLTMFQQPAPAWLGFEFRVFGHILIAIIGVVLLEQILRNVPQEERWGVKFFCLGIGVIFAYDFYLYSDALLFKQVSGDIWYSRGFVNAAIVPLIALAVIRNPLAKTSVLLSRNLVFYSTGLIIAGGYLIVISIAGYILGRFGGDWGIVLRHTFMFIALLGLLLLIFSGHMRARLRVFIDKHLLNYRYDYREEWLGLIRELSLSESHLRLEARALRALSEMVDSPAGSLWIKKNEREFYPVQAFSMAGLDTATEPADGSLARFLETWQWVINRDEYTLDPNLYQDLNLPNWLVSLENAWLVIPLMLQNHLYGFAVLAKPRAPREFNWEDIDLLKTAGRQVAIHLAQQQSAVALAESRQFEAFNRFSAYVVHDLKNLVSQLALVVQNAQKHRHNPEFMDDAILTVDNAVQRMNRLLVQLRSGKVTTKERDRIDLSDVLMAVYREKQNGRPVPELDLATKKIEVRADFDRLVSILGHVVQNGQDATPDHGRITLLLTQDEQMGYIEVSDNGCGMDEHFIKERLFKPFDTTKGLTGMGIGAHEVKAFVEELGGRVDIESEIDKGTVFKIWLPMANPASDEVEGGSLG